MKNLSLGKLTVAAVTAAAYAGISMALAPLSYGPVQLRIAEALCILPFFLPFTAWGLFAGCVISNLLSAYGPLDVIFGSLATLLSALCISSAGRKSGGTAVKAAACAFPAIFNGIFVGAVIALSTAGEGAFAAAFLLNAATVALGEAAVLYIIGLPLMIKLPKTPFFREFVRKFAK